eukprot:m.47323 g.47323  ORF g.47323 m.47323 type:complete len:863 (+) comp10970_c1_seq2:79-2667(+)
MGKTRVMNAWDQRGQTREGQRKHLAKLIKHGQIGDFFVRNAESMPGCFGLTVKVSKKKTMNFLIEQSEDWSLHLVGCRLDFSNLLSVLQYFSTGIQEPLPVQLTSIHDGASQQESREPSHAPVPPPLAGAQQQQQQQQYPGHHPALLAAPGVSQSLAEIERLATMEDPAARNAAMAHYNVLERQVESSQARVSALQSAIEHVRAGGDPSGLNALMTRLGIQAQIPLPPPTPMLAQQRAVPVANPGDSISAVIDMQQGGPPHPSSKSKKQRLRTVAEETTPLSQRKGPSKERRSSKPRSGEPEPSDRTSLDYGGRMEDVPDVFRQTRKKESKRAKEEAKRKQEQDAAELAAERQRLEGERRKLEEERQKMSLELLKREMDLQKQELQQQRELLEEERQLRAREQKQHDRLLERERKMRKEQSGLSMLVSTLSAPVLQAPMPGGSRVSAAQSRFGDSGGSSRASGKKGKGKGKDKAHRRTRSGSGSSRSRSSSSSDSDSDREEASMVMEALRLARERQEKEAELRRQEDEARAEALRREEEKRRKQRQKEEERLRQERIVHEERLRKEREEYERQRRQQQEDLETRQREEQLAAQAAFEAKQEQMRREQQELFERMKQEAEDKMAMERMAWNMKIEEEDKRRRQEAEERRKQHEENLKRMHEAELERERLEAQLKREQEMKRQKAAEEAARLRKQQENLIQQQRHFASMIETLQREEQLLMSEAGGATTLPSSSRSTAAVPTRSTAYKPHTTARATPSHSASTSISTTSSSTAPTPTPSARFYDPFKSGTTPVAAPAKPASSRHLIGASSGGMNLSLVKTKIPDRADPAEEKLGFGGDSSDDGGDGDDKCTYLGNCTCSKCRAA